MPYQREQWKSGYTYRQTCDLCETIIQYTDDKLDYRPWYPDGFVYCPTCKKPLRHYEHYAIDKKVKKTLTFVENFCPNCGNKFLANDKYCATCGRKRL